MGGAGKKSHIYIRSLPPLFVDGRLNPVKSSGFGYLLREFCVTLKIGIKKDRLGNLSMTDRGDRIRTCDLVLPKHPRYQAAPRPATL